MAHPYHHSLSSVKKWGGSVFDYLPLHSWFDQSKAIAARARHIHRQRQWYVRQDKNVERRFLGASYPSATADCLQQLAFANREPYCLHQRVGMAIGESSTSSAVRHQSANSVSRVRRLQR